MVISLYCGAREGEREDEFGGWENIKAPSPPGTHPLAPSLDPREGEFGTYKMYQRTFHE